MPAARTRPLGVFLASANVAQFAALRLVFEQQEDVRIVGGAKDTHGVLESVFKSGADFLLLDWELPVQSELLPRNGRSPTELAVPGLIAKLRAGEDRLHIVVLALKPEHESSALSAGADTVVAKTSAPERMLASLIAEIRKVEQRNWNDQNYSTATHPCT